MNYLRKTFLWILLLPYALGFLGAASNQLVFLVNHGKFPVMLNPVDAVVWQPNVEGMLTDYNPLTQEREIDPRHCAMTSATHLNWLADIFDFHEGKVSIGDLLIDSRAAILPYCWGIWLGLILTRKDPDGSEHELQTMQGAPRRFESMSMRLLRR